MHTESYDYISGQSLGATSLSFGDLIQNQHCVKPVVLRLIADITDSTAISNVRLFLENKGPWKDSEYSYYTDTNFSRIESGSSIFKSFTEVPGATSSSSGSVNLPWDGTTTDYLWLDAQIKQVTGMTQANFRLFFDV